MNCEFYRKKVLPNETLDGRRPTEEVDLGRNSQKSSHHVEKLTSLCNIQSFECPAREKVKIEGLFSSKPSLL